MQRNKAATLERVLQSAIQEFAHKGFHQTRVSDIASAARCSTETIYDVYVSKEGLFAAVVDDVFAAYIRDASYTAKIEVWILSHSDPVDRAMAALTAYAVPQMDETFLAILYQVLSARQMSPTTPVKALFQRRQYFIGQLERILEEGASQGQFVLGDAKDASTLLCYATGIVLGARERLLGEAASARSIFEDLRNALNAFCTPSGRARLSELEPTQLPAPEDA
jgi:AcrR family transcriptional regulator